MRRRYCISSYWFFQNNGHLFRNKANFSTTNPNAIIPMLVRIHARNVCWGRHRKRNKSYAKGIYPALDVPKIDYLTWFWDEQMIFAALSLIWVKESPQKSEYYFTLSHLQDWSSAFAEPITLMAERKRKKTSPAATTISGQPLPVSKTAPAATNTDKFDAISFLEHSQTDRIFMSSCRCCHNKKRHSPFAASPIRLNVPITS